MDMSRIDVAAAQPLDLAAAEARRGSLLFGLFAMAVWLPCLAAWLFARLVWRDLGRVAGLARLCGEAMRDARRVG